MQTQTNPSAPLRLHRSVRRLTAAVLSALLLAEPLLADASQANVWKDRRSMSPVKLASLPAPAMPALLPAARVAVENIPARAATRLPFAASLAPGLGRVTRVLPAARPSRPPVFFIQDVHGSLEAQTNIRAAVETLLPDATRPVLALEGAVGPLDLNRYRRFSRPDVLAGAADFLFGTLRISGPARAALAAGDSEVAGIDDAAWHARNVAAYLASAPLAADVKRKISDRAAALDAEKSTAFNADLRAFDRAVTEFRAGRQTMRAYAEALAPFDRSGELNGFLEAARLEAAIDFSKVEAERQRVLTRLVSRVSESELARLAQDAAAMRLGSLSPASFYGEFDRLCAGHGVTLKDAPSFALYLRYLRIADGIDGARLWASLGLLEQTGYARLATTPAERELIGRSRATALAARLADFALTPEEWADWKGGAGAASPVALTAFEDFYRAAEARDAAMARRVVELPDRPVILVAGGFHARGLADRLAADGRTVVVWTPQVKAGDARSTADALSVFAREKTPLEELFQGQKLFLADQPFRGLSDLPALVSALSDDPQRAVDELLPGAGVTTRVSAEGEVSHVALRRAGRATYVDVVHRGLKVLGMAAGRPGAFGRLTGAVYERLASRTGAAAALFAGAVGGFQEFRQRVLLGLGAGAAVTVLTGAGYATAASVALPALIFAHAVYFATADHPYGRFLDEVSARRLEPEHRYALASIALFLGLIQLFLLDPAQLTLVALLASSGLIGLAHTAFSLALASVGGPFAMAHQSLDDKRIGALVAASGKALPKLRRLSPAKFSEEVAAFRRIAAAGELDDAKIARGIALFTVAVEQALSDPRTDSGVAGYIGGPPTRRQIEAALALLDRRTITGMRPSEGKTLTVVLASFFQVALGRKVQIHDWNSPLSARDAQVAGAVLSRLGIRVGAFVGKNPKRFDPYSVHNREYPHLTTVVTTGGVAARRDAIRDLYSDMDVVYGPYDTMIYHWMDDWFGLTNGRLHPDPTPGWIFVEESDTPLLDAMGNPLVLARRSYALSAQRERMFRIVFRFANELQRDKYFTVERARIRFRSSKKLNQLVGTLERRLESADIRGLSGLLRQQSVKELLLAALEAKYLYRKNVDYFVTNSRIVIRNLQTGEVKPDERWARGIHTFMEIKEADERVPVQDPVVSDVAMTVRTFYNLIANWSGVAGVLDPKTRTDLEDNYSVRLVDFPPIFESQLDIRPPRYFRTNAAKVEAIVAQVLRLRVAERPILINAASPLEATRIAERLSAEIGKPVPVVDGRNEAHDAAVWNRMGERNAITVAAQVASRGHEIKISDDLYEPVSVPDFGDVGGLVVINTHHADLDRLEAQVRTRAGRRGRLGVYLQFDQVEENRLLDPTIAEENPFIRSDTGEPDPASFAAAIAHGRARVAAQQESRQRWLENRYNVLINAHGQFAELARAMISHGEEPERFFNLSSDILNRANVAIQSGNDAELKNQLARLAEENRYMSGVLKTPGLTFAESLALPQRLRLLRRLVNLTQKELAAEVGLDRPTYRTLEKGETSPKAETLRRLQRYYVNVRGYEAKAIARLLGQTEPEALLRSAAGAPRRELLRLLRESRWLTRDEMGELLHPAVSPQVIMHWENGDTAPTDEQLRQIAYHFVENEGFDLTALFTALGIESRDDIVAALEGKPLGEIFVGLRATRELTEVARALGVSVQAVLKWEKGIRPRDSTLRSIIDYYSREGYKRDGLRKLFGFPSILETEAAFAGKTRVDVIESARAAVPLGKNEFAKLLKLTLPGYSGWIRTGFDVAQTRRVAAVLATFGFSERRLLEAAGVPEPATVLPALEGRPLSEAVRGIMDATGESTTDIGNVVGLPPDAVNRWFTGTRIPRRARVRLISHWVIRWKLPQATLRRLLYVPTATEITDALANQTADAVMDLLQGPYDLTDNSLENAAAVPHDTARTYRLGRIIRREMLEEIATYFADHHRFNQERVLAALLAANGKIAPGTGTASNASEPAPTEAAPQAPDAPDGAAPGVWPIWGRLHRWAVAGDRNTETGWRLPAVVTAIGFVEEFVARPLLGALLAYGLPALGLDPLTAFSAGALLYAIAFATLLHPVGYVGRGEDPGRLTVAQRMRLFALALLIGVFQGVLPLPWWLTYPLLGLLHATYNLWSLATNGVLAVVPPAVRKAAETLMDDAATDDQRVAAIETIAANPSTIDLLTLNRALEKYVANERIVRAILDGFLTLRRTGVLNRRDLRNESIRGIIRHALRDFNVSADSYRLVALDRGHEYQVRFSFPPDRPFDDIDRVMQRMRELYSQKNAAIAPTIGSWTDSTQPPNTVGFISIRIPLSHANLTDIQRMFGTLEYLLSPRGRYRAYLPMELANKLEEMVWEFLDGIPETEPEYHALVAEMYGTGAADRPGLLTALRLPGRYGATEFIPVESNPQENASGWDRRSDARISLNAIRLLARYLPFFTHFIPEEGIQRWGYLARAGGPARDAAWYKGMFFGLEEDDLMLFLSNDTLGYAVTVPLREYIGGLIGVTGMYHPATGQLIDGKVRNYTALKLAVREYFRRRYLAEDAVSWSGGSGVIRYRKATAWHDQEGRLHELLPVYDRVGPGAVRIAQIHRVQAPNPNDMINPKYVDPAPSVFSAIHVQADGSPGAPFSADELAGLSLPAPKAEQLTTYALNAAYRHAKSTPFLENLRRTDENGKPIRPTVAVIDEVANGSFDFLEKAAIEWNTRVDESELPVPLELGNLRRREPWKLTEAEIARWDALERERMAQLDGGDAVDVEIFIGRQRNSEYTEPLPGYPSLDVERMAREFGINRAEAERAREATTMNANQIPHLYEKDYTRYPWMPVLGAIPVRYEEPAIQIAAFLTTLEIYNGMVRFFRQSFDRLAATPMLRLLESPGTPASVREQIVGMLDEFSFRQTLIAVVRDAARNPALAEVLEPVVGRMFRHYFEEALVFNETGPIAVRYFEALRAEEPLMGFLSRDSNPFADVRLMAERSLALLREKTSSVVVLSMTLSDYRALSIEQIARLRAGGFYPAPLLAADETVRQEEMSRLLEAYGSLETRDATTADAVALLTPPPLPPAAGADGSVTAFSLVLLPLLGFEEPGARLLGTLASFGSLLYLLLRQPAVRRGARALGLAIAESLGASLRAVFRSVGTAARRFRSPASPASPERAVAAALVAAMAPDAADRRLETARRLNAALAGAEKPLGVGQNPFDAMASRLKDGSLDKERLGVEIARAWNETGAAPLDTPTARRLLTDAYLAQARLRAGDDVPAAPLDQTGTLWVMTERNAGRAQEVIRQSRADGTRHRLLIVVRDPSLLEEARRAAAGRPGVEVVLDDGGILAGTGNEQVLRLDPLERLGRATWGATFWTSSQLRVFAPPVPFDTDGLSDDARLREAAIMILDAVAAVPVSVGTLESIAAIAVVIGRQA